MRRGEYQGAHDDLSEALARLGRTQQNNARRAELYLSRGIVNARLGDLDAAIEDYTDAIQLQPEYWESYFLRWQAFLEQGEKSRAAQDRQKGMRLNPDIFKHDYSTTCGII